MKKLYTRAAGWIAVAFVTAAAGPTHAQESIYPGWADQQLLEALDADYSPTNWYGYDAARDTLFLRIHSENQQLRCVYTGYTITLDEGEDPTTSAFNKGINTEHTWPQSMGADVLPAKSDMHHLYPVKDNVNSSRSNHPYDEIPDAETETWYWTDQSSSTIPSADIDAWSEKDNDNPNPGYTARFEPREDHKGDAARAVFYFVAVYPNLANTDFFEVQKDVLRSWHYDDLPTDEERARSVAIAAHQGTENPFVIDTTLARRAFFEESAGESETVVYTFEENNECPTTDDEPSQDAVWADFQAFTRTGVECNDAAGVFNSRGWPSSQSDEHYVEFSGFSAADVDMSFDEGSSISFIARRSGTGPTEGELQYQVGGEAFQVLGSWVLDDTNPEEVSFSLEPLGQTGGVWFRFYAWGSSSDQGTLRFDDVQLGFGIVGTDVEDMPELPAAFDLLAAYPNPFNPSTTLTLRFHRAGDVSVEMIDVLGRRVQLVDRRWYSPGEHQVRIDAGSLPSGVYLVRAAGAGQVVTQRVVLAK